MIINWHENGHAGRTHYSDFVNSFTSRFIWEQQLKHDVLRGL